MNITGDIRSNSPDRYTERDRLGDTHLFYIQRRFFLETQTKEGRSSSSRNMFPRRESSTPILTQYISSKCHLDLVSYSNELRKCIIHVLVYKTTMTTLGNFLQPKQTIVSFSTHQLFCRKTFTFTDSTPNIDKPY